MRFFLFHFVFLENITFFFSNFILRPPLVFSVFLGLTEPCINSGHPWCPLTSEMRRLFEQRVTPMVVHCSLNLVLMKLFCQIKNKYSCILFTVGSGSTHLCKELLTQEECAKPCVPAALLRWV